MSGPLEDPAGARVWEIVSGESPFRALVWRYQVRPSAWVTASHLQEYTWTTDALGRPYVASVTNTLDNDRVPLQSKTEQTTTVTDGTQSATLVTNTYDKTPSGAWHHHR